MAQLTAHRDLASLPLKLPMLTVSRRTWRPQRRGMAFPAALLPVAVRTVRRSLKRPQEPFGTAELLQLEMKSDEPQALSELLEGLGALSTAVRGVDAILRETATDETPMWRVAVVTGMFPASVDVEKIMAVVQSCFDLQDSASWTVTRVEDIDWVEHVQRSWKPMNLGQGFQVLLPWHDGPSGGTLTSKNRLVLRL